MDPWTASTSGGACLLVLLLVSALGCGGRFVVLEKDAGVRFRHRDLGYEIDKPPILGEHGWAMAELEGSDLLVRHPDGAVWAIASSCRPTSASARMLAAELARATGGRPRGRGQAVEHAGLPGWTQRLERREGEQRIEIKTVTLRGVRCTYDWMLVAPNVERFDALETGFEAWWQSFVPAPTERPAGAGS